MKNSMNADTSIVPPTANELLVEQLNQLLAAQGLQEVTCVHVVSADDTLALVEPDEFDREQLASDFAYVRALYDEHFEYAESLEEAWEGTLTTVASVDELHPDTLQALRNEDLLEQGATIADALHRLAEAMQCTAQRATDTAALAYFDFELFFESIQKGYIERQTGSQQAASQVLMQTVQGLGSILPIALAQQPEHTVSTVLAFMAKLNEAFRV